MDVKGCSNFENRDSLMKNFHQPFAKIFSFRDKGSVVNEKC
jgi:hypothetical protein